MHLFVSRVAALYSQQRLPIHTVPTTYGKAFVWYGMELLGLPLQSSEGWGSDAHEELTIL